MILDYIYVIYLYTNTIPKNVPSVERSFLKGILIPNQNLKKHLTTLHWQRLDEFTGRRPVIGQLLPILEILIG